jgi:hypothetical protein
MSQVSRFDGVGLKTRPPEPVSAVKSCRGIGLILEMLPWPRLGSPVAAGAGLPEEAAERHRALFGPHAPQILPSA